ncbi:MAG: hypothetical protein H6599_00855 [Flavobacteriales bacterium]|nr:hypothetical protein [Flavobacteriales bacterium]
MKKLYLLILAMSMMFASCMSSRTTTTREIKTSESTVYQKKLIAELEVDVTKKINGTATVKLTGADQLEGKIGGGDPYERAKNLAKWNAIETSNADAIADPIYNINQKGNTVTVEVQGFYSKFKNIEVATNDDLLLYIETKLSSGTGILGVSFEQFKAFYETKYEAYDIPEDEKMSEVELEQLYDQYVDQALELQATSKSSTTTTGKKGVGKKILIGYLAAGVVVLILGRTIALLS